MIKPLISFQLTSCKKLLFLVLILSLKTINGAAQNYVNISLADPANGGFPLQNGASSDYLINVAGGNTGVGLGWGANLYTANELGVTNKIYDLSWLSKSNYTTTDKTFEFKDVDVWMYHYNSDQFLANTRPDVQSGNIVGASNLTKVASGKSFVLSTPKLGTKCVFTLTLDTPFDYIAGNNLVIYIEKKTIHNPVIIEGPLFMHNTDATNKKRRISNWIDGTIANPLPTSHNSSVLQKSFARVLFNVVYSGITPLDGVNGTSGSAIYQCIPPTCTTPVISNKSTTICSNNTFTFSPINTSPDVVPDGTTYKWTFTDNPNVTGEANETTGKTSIASGSNLINTSNTSQDVVYTVTPTSGTCVGVPFTFTISVKPKPDTPIFSSVTQPTCIDNGIAQITNFISAPAIYTFNPSSGISVDASGKITASPGNYKFVVKNDICNSDSSDLLVMNPVPGKPFIEGPSSVCLGSEITLNAWTDNTKSTKSIPSANSPWLLKDPYDSDTVSLTVGTDPALTSRIVKALIAASSPTEATIIYTDINGCKTEQIIAVNNTPPTLSPLNEGKGVCLGSPLELKASIPGGVWTCLTPQLANLSFGSLYPKIAGPATVEIKYQLDQKNCNASITEFVKIYPEPKIVGAVTSCIGDTVRYTDVSNNDPFNQKTTWSVINKNVASIDQNGLLTAINSGGTEIWGENIFGCVSQSFINIRPTAIFTDTTIYTCSGLEKSFIPILKNTGQQLNPTFTWTVTNSNSVDGESEMKTSSPNFKQLLVNNSGSGQFVTYTLTSSVGQGTDACLVSRKLNVEVESALDIIGVNSIELGNQVQFSSINKIDKTLTWSSSNPQIVAVNNTGMVASKGIGSAIVTVSNSAGCSAQMNVNVIQGQNKKITGQNSVCEGGSIILNGFGNPNPVNPWTSSSQNVLVINSKGEITAIKSGKSVVTYVDDQGSQDTLSIFVKAKPSVDSIPNYTICPGYFNDSIKFKGTVGARFDWYNSNTATGIPAKDLNFVHPFKAFNNGSSNLISEISVTPTLGQCVGAIKKFNITVRYTPKLDIIQLDTIVCPGGNINFKTELSPSNTSSTYQWFVNDAKVGVNSAIYWSKTLKNKDKITVNATSKDFCFTTANLFVRMDTLRLSMNAPSMVYLKSPAINLVGYPSGGVFTGKGITNNILNPSVAGVGNKIVSYTFKNANNCGGVITQKVVIYDTVFNNCHLTTYDTVKVMDTVSILKIKFKLTTGIKANQETSMRVYPNPTSDILLIEADEKALLGYRYKLVDAAGKEVYNQPVKSPLTEISLKSLGAAGTYFFEVFDEKFQRVVSKKIILD